MGWIQNTKTVERESVCLCVCVCVWVSGGDNCVLFSIRYSSQVTCTVYKAPAAPAQWRHMFIDASGCPWAHNMAETNKHQHTEGSQSRQQMNKYTNMACWMMGCFHIETLGTPGRQAKCRHCHWWQAACVTGVTLQQKTDSSPTQRERVCYRLLLSSWLLWDYLSVRSGHERRGVQQ